MGGGCFFFFKKSDQLPRALFQRLSFETHLDVVRTLLAPLWFKLGLSKSLHQVILADLPHLRATETTYTSWTCCDSRAHILLRVNSALSGGMTMPQSKNNIHTSYSTISVILPLSMSTGFHSVKLVQLDASQGSLGSSPSCHSSTCGSQTTFNKGAILPKARSSTRCTAIPGRRYRTH